MDFAILRIDREYRPGEPALQEIGHQGVADRPRLIACPHHRHLPRFHDSVQIVLSHVVTPYVVTPSLSVATPFISCSPINMCSARQAGGAGSSPRLTGGVPGNSLLYTL